MRFGEAMIASVFHPSVGGIQTHTLHLSEKLRKRGVDAFVLTRSNAGLARDEKIRGVPTHRRPQSVLAEQRRPILVKGVEPTHGQTPEATL